MVTPNVVIKSFDDDDGHAKWYFGTVASYDDEAKSFKVHYIDGDEEEFDEEEVHQHLAPSTLRFFIKNARPNILLYITSMRSLAL